MKRYVGLEQPGDLYQKFEIPDFEIGSIFEDDLPEMVGAEDGQHFVGGLVVQGEGGVVAGSVGLVGDVYFVH
jgi:hypothetical protein